MIVFDFKNYLLNILSACFRRFQNPIPRMSDAPRQITQRGNHFHVNLLLTTVQRTQANELPIQ